MVYLRCGKPSTAWLSSVKQEKSEPLSRTRKESARHPIDSGHRPGSVGPHPIPKSFPNQPHNPPPHSHGEDGVGAAVRVWVGGVRLRRRWGAADRPHPRGAPRTHQDDLFLRMNFWKHLRNSPLQITPKINPRDLEYAKESVWLPTTLSPLFGSTSHQNP